MRFTVLFNLIIFMLVFPISGSCEEEEKVIKTLEEKYTEVNWINAISKDATLVTMELKGINRESPEGQINKVLQNALETIKQMRKDAEKQGIVVEGFSLNLAFPPSITIDFRFMDEARTQEFVE